MTAVIFWGDYRYGFTNFKTDYFRNYSVYEGGAETVAFWHTHPGGGPVSHTDFAGATALRIDVYASRGNGVTSKFTYSEYYSAETAYARQKVSGIDGMVQKLSVGNQARGQFKTQQTDLIILGKSPFVKDI